MIRPELNHLEIPRVFPLPPRLTRQLAPSTARRRSLLALLGPGLITGASDDDPSGIGTYSQAGAQFGYSTTWVMLFSYPLIAAIQEVCARIGRVTGHRIAGNIRSVTHHGSCVPSYSCCSSPTPSISKHSVICSLAGFTPPKQ
jgi:hypothetical protein